MFILKKKKNKIYILIKSLKIKKNWKNELY